jgi:hypothetical protein
MGDSSMTQRFPGIEDIVAHEQMSAYGRAWQVLALARQQDAIHEVVLRHWQTQLQTGFEKATRSGWPANAQDTTLSTVLAEMASVVRPPFERVRQWGLAAALGLSTTSLPALVPVQVFYSADAAQPLTVGGGTSVGYWKITLPLLAWANPLAWSLPAATEPSAGISPLLKAVASLTCSFACDASWPAEEDCEFGTNTLTDEAVLTLAEQATQGLLFSARPAPVPSQQGCITEQLASVSDTPLSPTDILHVSAAVWVLQASGLSERLKTHPPTLAQVAAGQAQWLHLTLKSWETAQLHQYLQAASSPVASTAPPVALAVGV